MSVRLTDTLGYSLPSGIDMDVTGGRSLVPLGSWVTTVAACSGLLTLLVFARMIYNAFLHPLRKYPGPKLWAATRLPWCWHQYRGKLHRRLLELHLRYGSPLRVAPTEIIYTTDTAWKAIYGQRLVEMGKDPIFSVTNPSGIKTILSANRANHSRQRRLLSHAFSEKALSEQEGILLANVDRLVERLSETCSSGPTNMVAWVNFVTFDVIGDLSFGQDFKCVEKGEYDDFVRSISTGAKELMLSQMMRYYRIFSLQQLLMPKTIARSRAANLERARATVERRIQRDTDRKDFLHYILGADEEKGMTKREIVANAFIFMIAGSESTASWLSGTLFYILNNTNVYKRLVDEVRSMFNSEDEIRLADANNLEYMDAVANEASRMFPPVPTVLPRVVPPGGEVIDGMYVPPGTTVGVHHYTTYRSPDNFHRPDEFLPERWLPGRRDTPPFDRDNKASFQAFSYGPRVCLGKNLARAEMRLVLSRLLWRFDLELVKGQENWIHDQTAFGLWWKTPLMCNLSPSKRYSMSQKIQKLHQ